MANELFDLDRFDSAILSVLAEDGRISITDLARRIGLSKSPTQARLRRLEESGVILGYRALLDPIRLGLDHVAFVEVRLNDTREAALRAFNLAVAKVPEIEQTYSAGAVCLALLNAALASGWGANWLSGWASHDPQFCAQGFGLAPHERVAGVIHIGTETTPPPERPRPDVVALTTWMTT